MSTLNDLEPGSHEYEAELDRLQAIEDAEREGEGGNTDGDGQYGEDVDDDGDADGSQAGEGGEDGDQATQVAETQTAAEPAGEQGKPVKVAGVASKDGKAVLPYSALKAERQRAGQATREANELREQLQHAQQQIADIKAGKTAEPDEPGEDDELDELAQDFPQLAKVVRGLKETKAELAAQRAKKDTTNATEEVDPQKQEADEALALQEDIDTVPALVDWQNDPAHAEKFARAAVLDDALKDSPKWRNKPRSERFEHVARLVADEFDIQIDEDAASPASKPQPSKRTDPAKAIEQATRTKPNTLSDFKGGAVTAEQRGGFERQPLTKQVNALTQMSDAEFQNFLLRNG